ncbi:MAG: hypothetical protein LUQ38_10745 [Methanotrichaceae archaeon]|nr:hypothetical protein [Methanotrichaceae archaeon]
MDFQPLSHFILAEASGLAFKAFRTSFEDMDWASTSAFNQNPLSRALCSAGKFPRLKSIKSHWMPWKIIVAAEDMDVCYLEASPCRAYFVLTISVKAQS